MLLYSAKKKKVNPIEEYSTLYPETNSDSASGKSKGILLVSANPDKKKRINDGNKGIIKKISDCANTIVVKFIDLTKIKIGIIIKPMEIS